jgi:hypothetical protein
MAAEKVAWRVKQQSTSYPSDNNTDECEDDDIHEREGDDKYGHYVLDIGIKAIKIRRIWVRVSVLTMGEMSTVFTNLAGRIHSDLQLSPTSQSSIYHVDAIKCDSG